MARTLAEKRIIQRRRTQGVLRPRLEEFFKYSVKFSSEADAQFIAWLMQKQVERDQARDAISVFSPSGLADCLRQVYLRKNYKEHGLERVEIPRIEPNYYFHHGDFIHLKWAHALWRLSLVDSGVEILEFELPVLSKRRDHGGTLDVLMKLDGEPLVIDWKGVNVRTFQQFVNGDPPIQYVIQLADYIMLVNAMAQRQGLLKKGQKITRGLIMAENKGGPDRDHPLALHEHEVKLKDHLPKVQARLEVLRNYDSEKEIPPPECQSTGSLQFQSCPFSKFCKKEVKEIQERNRELARSDANGLKVAIPRAGRSNRSRRSRPK